MQNSRAVLLHPLWPTEVMCLNKAKNKDLQRKHKNKTLTFTTLLVNLADDKLVMFFLFCPQKTGFDISCKLFPLETICMKWQISFSGKNRIWHFMQIVSTGDNLHEMANLLFWEKWEKIFQHRQQIGDIFLILPRKQDLTFYANCFHRKWQISFSGKNEKKYFNMPPAENFNQSAKFSLLGNVS